MEGSGCDIYGSGSTVSGDSASPDAELVMDFPGHSPIP